MLPLRLWKEARRRRKLLITLAMAVLAVLTRRKMFRQAQMPEAKINAEPYGD
jgi:hypothetical protein